MKMFSKPYAFRLISFLILAFLSFSLFGCNGDDTATPDESTAPVLKFEIAVIKSDSTDNSNNILEGFEKHLKEAGYTEGENISIKYYESQEEKPDFNALAKQAAGDNPDLIFTVGSKAAKAAKKATAEIPIIFAGVSDPIGAGLVKSTEKPDGNITGVSSFTPVFEQLEFIKELIPEAKKISVLYKETAENSILISSLVKEECEDFSLQYKAFAVKDKDKLSDELKKALKDCQVLYLPEDDLTKDSIKDIIKEADKKKVPVFSSNTSLVKSGALASCVPDHKEIGARASEMALAVLDGTKNIKEMSVIYPDECIKVVNTDTLKKFGIKISDEEKNIISV